VLSQAPSNLWCILFAIFISTLNICVSYRFWKFMEFMIKILQAGKVIESGLANGEQT